MDWINTLNVSVMQFHTIILALMVILHLFIATAIARDVGALAKRQIPPVFMAGSVWVLAGLLTGIWGLLVYWLVHHSSMAR